MGTYSKKPRRLGEALDEFMAKTPKNRAFVEGKILDAFPEIVGVQIAEKCIKLTFKGDILWVKVPDTAWRNELFYQRHKIKKRLNKVAGMEIIRELRLSY